ncbi:MAG: response regulator transcription factor [Nitrosomonadaceae bacterium]
MIKLLLVDDHSIFRSGIREMLETESDIKVMAEAGTSVEALISAKKQKFDIAVLDISLPDSSGLDLTKKLIRAHPEIKILMLSSYDESVYGLRSLKLGASGYLTKDCSIEVLIYAIRKVAAGSKYISLELSEKIAQLFGNKGVANHEELSSREFEVFRMIVQGISLVKIAEKLHLSSNTVKTYRTRILSKLDLKDNSELISYAVANNLLT